MSEKLIAGIFTIATVALILIHKDAVASMLTSGGKNYGTFVKDLQGRG